MLGYRPVFLLMLILTIVAFALVGSSLLIVYETAVGQAQKRLGDLAENEAATLSALVHDLENGGMALPAARDTVLRLMQDADGRTPRIGETGQFAVARRNGDHIDYLLLDHQLVRNLSLPMRTTASPDEAMRAALVGQSGTLIGRDHRGEQVVASFMPVTELDAGLVAQIDLAEIRRPFVRAGIAVAILAVVLIALGTTLFFQVAAPMVRDLANKERRFRELVDRMSSGLLVLRATAAKESFVIQDVNRAAEAIEQLPREWMIGRPLTEVLPGAAACGLLAACCSVRGSGEPKTLNEVHYLDARLSQWREIRLYRLPSDDVVCLYDDITAHKLTEERLQETQKLELLGQLTGGIAHDFNNLLGIVAGNLQLLAEESLPSDARRMLGDALWAANRAAKLTHHLLAYARKQPLQPQLTDVSVLLQDMEDVLRRALDVSVRARLPDRLWPIFVDRSQLQNAIVSLVVNAREAMPDGGTVTIETADAHLGDDEVMEGGDVAPAGDYVMIAVRDTGVGMSSDVAKRAFEPFFTTKGAAKGSGLGLSMVYGFVRQSGGCVRLRSALGEGTSVELYLPRAAVPVYSGHELISPTDDEGVDVISHLANQAGSRRLLAPQVAALRLAASSRAAQTPAQFR